MGRAVPSASNSRDQAGIKAEWKDVKGKARVKWGKLTDDDLAQAQGNREQLEAAVQKRYGIAKQEAQAQVDQWILSLKRLIEPKPKSGGKARLELPLTRAGGVEPSSSAGLRSLASASLSICRMRSRDSENRSPTSESVIPTGRSMP